MRRLRQEFLNIKTTDARNKYISQNKNVKNLIIRKKTKYYQNKLMLESNCKTKTFFENFKEMSGKGKNSKSFNLSNGTLSILMNTTEILAPDLHKANQTAWKIMLYVSSNRCY